MFRNLMENLSRTQKIGLAVLLQLIVIAILVLTVRGLTAEQSHVVIDAKTEMPETAENFIEENIWELIKDKVAEVNQNEIKDAVIREGSYSEVVEEDGSVQASFIVDIDSLKQSYVVKTGWSADKREVYEVVVDCPPLDQMKYPETVCYGTYNNTYSLDLYLPYMVYPEGYDEEDAEVVAPNIYISGDEDSKVVDVMVSKCDAENFKKQAMEYLDTLPIDFSKYTINYGINDINVEC